MTVQDDARAFLKVRLGGYSMWGFNKMRRSMAKLAMLLILLFGATPIAFGSISEEERAVSDLVTAGVTSTIGTQTSFDHFLMDKDAEESSCEDNVNRFLVEGYTQKKNCLWVSLYKDERCQLSDAQHECPKTCDICGSRALRGGFPSPASWKSNDNDNVDLDMGDQSAKSGKKHPSSSDTATPSTPPTQCMDLPQIVNGIEMGLSWTMPDDGIWKDSSYAGMTCAKLEASIPVRFPDEQKKLCAFLSEGISSGPCAIEACCFCGGGQDHFEPRCKNLGWNEVDNNYNCEIPEKFNKEEQETFCRKFGNDSFAKDGLTMKAACCACGGGLRHYDHEFGGEARRQRGRKLHEDEGAINAGAAAATVLPDGTSFVDFTSRVGSGDSPGIPNLEYLGLGYDYISGNPRGTVSSELDPGFRYRILALRRVQSNVTNDSQFTVPIGTDIKYTSSCKFDSSSKEVSSDSDRRESYSSEVTSSFSASVSASGSYGIFSASLQSEYAFSQSEKFQSASSISRSERKVSFESKAMCSEYEASFIPTYDLTLALDPLFKMSLDNLPMPYNQNNVVRREWKKFFDTYGTHYVRSLVLGGKRVYTTSMTQQDYSSLVSNSVDVASTMSFDVSASFGINQNDRDSSSKGNIANNGDGANGSVFIAEASSASADKSLEESKNKLAIEVAVSTAKSASSTSQSEQALKIAEKKLEKSEDTVGGLPKKDWREWAESVKSRPMPIKYDLVDFSDLMTYEQYVAYFAALLDIFDLNLSPTTEELFLNDTTRYGVYTGTGNPLSKNTLDPNDKTRVLMQVDAITSINDEAEEEKTTKEVIFEHGAAKGDWFTSEIADANFGACGVQATWMKLKDCDADDDVGIYQMKFNYCNTNDWDEQTGFITPIANVQPGDFIQKVVLDDGSNNAVIGTREWECNSGEFVCGFKIAYCGLDQDNACEGCTFDDDHGIFAMRTYCKKIGQACLDTPFVGVNHCEDGHESKGEGCDNDPFEGGEMASDPGFNRYNYFIQEDDTNDPGTDFIIVGAETKFDQNADDDHVGISGLKLVLRQTKISSAGGQGPPSKIFTYSDVWKGKPLAPIAQFATPIRLDIVPDVFERDQFPFKTTFAGKFFDSDRDNVLFTVTKNINSAGVLGMMNFGELDLEKIGNSRLQSFSYLNVDDLGRYGSDFTSGVIAYNGVQVNPSGKNKFAVSKDRNKFIVEIANGFITDVPTVVASPNWFTTDNLNYPQKVDDLIFTIEQISTDKFEIRHGVPSLDRSYLGFNVLVIGSGMPIENVKHGIIDPRSDDFVGDANCKTLYDDLSASPSSPFTTHGITVSKCYSGPKTSAVEITFDTPFTDIPCVIVTPYNTETIGALFSDVQRCVVESITEKNAVVKCVWLRGPPTNIPFTFVAVGKGVTAVL